MDEDSGCHGQDGDVCEEVTQRNNFTLKEYSEGFFFFYDIESAKDEMLEDDSNSEKNIIYQSIEKMLALYSKLYHEKHS